MRTSATLGLLLSLAALGPMAACGSGNMDPAPRGSASPHPSGSATTAPTTTAPILGDGGPDGSSAVGGGLPRWNAPLGGPDADTGYAIAGDAAGNSVIVGTFQHTATLGGVAMKSAGAIDFFVAKYTPAGVPLWVRPFGGLGNDAATSVAVDSAGNVYVAGASDGEIDFGDGSLGADADAGVAAGTFLIQLDTFGNVQVAKTFGGLSYGTTVGVAVAPDGTIALCGSYQAGLDLGGGPLPAPAGTFGAFVASFAPGIALSFVKPLGGAGVDSANGVGFGAEDTVVVVGSFTGTGDFGGGPVTSAGLTDVFTTAFASSGALVWSKTWGGSDEDNGRAIAVAPTGEVFLAGGFSTTVDFGMGPTTSLGATDAFVMKLNASGSLAWVRTYGGAGGDEAEAIAVDSGGNTLVGGIFEATMMVGVTPFVSAGDQDIFAIKLGSSASNLWSKHFGGAEADQGLGVAYDAQGRAYVTGYFRTAVDFGTGPQVSAGDDDIFVASFDP